MSCQSKMSWNVLHLAFSPQKRSVFYSRAFYLQKRHFCSFQAWVLVRCVLLHYIFFRDLSWSHREIQAHTEGSSWRQGVLLKQTVPSFSFTYLFPPLLVFWLLCNRLRGDWKHQREGRCYLGHLITNQRRVSAPLLAPRSSPVPPHTSDPNTPQSRPQNPTPQPPTPHPSPRPGPALPGRLRLRGWDRGRGRGLSQSPPAAISPFVPSRPALAPTLLQGPASSLPGPLGAPRVP